MHLNKYILITFFLALATNSLSVAQTDLTCTSKIGGSWNFGTAPSACNVSPLMTQALTRGQYTSLLFDDKTDVSSARKDFLSEMFPLLRDVTTAYLIRKDPNMSPAELAGFLDGVYALAHQETFWTHYRDGKDQVIRYMRGDYDHGHGMMQVDDRSHVDALRQGRGVDLVYNIVYGLDVYYKAWVRSATASCVSSATNYKSRARSAWAAYNGGSGKICRWTSNTTGDKQYLEKFEKRTWLNYVHDTKAPVSVDVNCLMFNERPCLTTGTPVPPTEQPPTDSAPHELLAKTVIVVASNGINLRDLRTNNVILLIPKGKQVLVEDVSQKDSDIKTYLKVTYSGKTGSIYAGHEKPTNTRNEWVRVQSAQPQNNTAVLASNLPYKLLRECAGFACAKNSVAIKGGDSPDTLMILKKENSVWAEVQIIGTTSTGWIELAELTEIKL